MPTSTINLNMDKLLNDITTQVSSMVKSHIEEQLKSVSIHIANVYKLNQDEVWDTIQSKISQMDNNVETSVRRQPKKVIAENEMCCMSTKAGTPCKYRRIEGDTMCKKHKKTMNTEPQPTAPQSQEESITFTRTFFPSRVDDEIIDDLQSDDEPSEYVTDE